MSRSLLGLCLILLVALWLRAPFIYAGLPYLTDEDEAHHHNRVVNMVKQGDFNPRYFHKPSLHFYLRMPIVSAAFLWSVRAQEVQKVAEIITADPFGIAGYAFSAYPERILIWDRGFSVLLSLISIALVYLIALKLGASSTTAKVSTLIAAVSPAAVSLSATVSVDVVMTCLCLATTLAALLALKAYSFKRLCVVALLAGLAVSSKYNALPIIAVPLAVAMSASSTRLLDVCGALILAALGFLGASPYILASLPLFLDQFAYEIWHYGVAGHIGHQAEPGLAQARFYLDWLAQDAIGWIGVLCSVVLLVRVARMTAATVVTITFPALYFLLMISQRANFTRNMLVLIPYCAIAIAFGLDFLAQRSLGVLRSHKQAWFYSIGVAVLILPLAWKSLSLRSQIRQMPESRIDASKWLESLDGESAIAGQLQFAPQTLSAARHDRVDLNKTSIEQLYQSGYSRVLVPKGAVSQSQLSDTVLEHSFPGNPWPQRVVANPAIDVFRLELDPQKKIKLATSADLVIGRDQQFSCASNDVRAEGHCWLNHRVAAIELQFNPALGLKLAVMSPWPKQSLARLDPDGKVIELLKGNQLTPGEWRELEFAPPGSLEKRIVVLIGEIHVPASYKIGDDKRRLGLAVKFPAGTNKQGE